MLRRLCLFSSRLRGCCARCARCRSAALLFFDAADPLSPTSFIGQRFKPTRLWKYRPALHGHEREQHDQWLSADSSHHGDAFDTPDNSGHGGSLFANFDWDDSTHGGVSCGGVSGGMAHGQQSAAGQQQQPGPGQAHTAADLALRPLTLWHTRRG